MDLQSFVDQAQSQLDAQQKELDAQAKDLSDHAAALVAKKKELDQRESDVVAKETDLDQRESVLAGQENTEAEIKRLTDVRDEATQRLVAARQAEDRLVAVNQALSDREEKVATRERVVSVREAEYKEQIKKDFLDEVAKKLQ